ncbi:hypothetical protein [Paenibacillus oleatilyticus]|uniref:Uncharacterized protein n=1 Tax=Paenibacillus oleatilyticus TaxID=2594886 RepID=A0ABV4VCB7_9BACL
MSERFKIVCQHYGVTYFSETDGEEVFTFKGIRYFAHRYRTKESGGWRVSCTMSGIALGKGVFKEDAVRMARKKLYESYSKYLHALKTRERAIWRPKATGSTETA